MLHLLSVQSTAESLNKEMAQLKLGLPSRTGGIRGVDTSPELLEQLFVGDLFRIVSYEHRLEMAGRSSRHLLIGRILYGAPGVAGDRLDNAGHQLEG